jgi:hypothetical protein
LIVESIGGLFLLVKGYLTKEVLTIFANPVSEQTLDCLILVSLSADVLSH